MKKKEKLVFPLCKEILSTNATNDHFLIFLVFFFFSFFNSRYFYLSTSCVSESSETRNWLHFITNLSLKKLFLLCMCIYIFIASLNYESWLQCFFKVKKELTHFQILNFRIYNGTFLSFFQQQANNCSHFLFPHYRLQLHDIISNSSYHYKRTVIITISSPRESARLSSSPRKDPFNSLPPFPFLNPITLELAIIYTWNTDSIPQNRVQNSI